MQTIELSVSEQEEFAHQLSHLEIVPVSIDSFFTIVCASYVFSANNNNVVELKDFKSVLVILSYSLKKSIKIRKEQILHYDFR